MILADRYRIMKEHGLTTQYLARMYGRHPRSIRRVVAESISRPRWVKECRIFIVSKIEGMTYEEFWNIEIDCDE
jgi:hypothetical protein